MTKNLTKNKRKVTLLFAVLILALLVNVFNTPIESVEAQTPGTVVGVAPQEISIGEIDQIVDTLHPTDPFVVNITVTNVTDLYAWEAKIYYNSAILNWTAGWYPSDHVFAEANTTGDFIGVTPVSGDDVFGVYATYVNFGGTLKGEIPGINVTGSGTLYQLEFRGIGAGNSTLTMKEPYRSTSFDTYLLDSSAKQDIPMTLEDGTVTVVGEELPPPVPGKANSTISINVNPGTVTVGSDVTVSGAISTNETKVNVDVKIQYRLDVTGETWATLATVKTGSDASYSYSWETNQKGTFEVKASWLGDDKTNPAVSETKLVTVQEEEEAGPDYTLYILIAGVAIVVIAVIAVYFLKFR